MKRNGRAVPTVLAWALLASGCVPGTFNEPTPAMTAAPAAIASPLLSAVATAPIGTSLTVNDPQFGVVRVTLDREYNSAAGVPCRRFTLVGALAGQGGTRVACRETAGWSLVSLQGPSPGTP